MPFNDSSFRDSVDQTRNPIQGKLVVQGFEHLPFQLHQIHQLGICTHSLKSGSNVLLFGKQDLVFMLTLGKVVSRSIHSGVGAVVHLEKENTKNWKHVSESLKKQRKNIPVVSS